MIQLRVDNVSRRQSNFLPKGRLFLEAEATGGRRQKIIRRQVSLETASSGFCLPIGSSSQNLFLEAECFGGRRQSGGGSHWRPPSEDNSEASWFRDRLQWLLPPDWQQQPELIFGGRMFWRPPPIGRQKPLTAAVRRCFGGKLI